MVYFVTQLCLASGSHCAAGSVDSDIFSVGDGRYDNSELKVLLNPQQ